MSLFGMFSKQKQAPHFVEGRVGYAVGDIHGRVDLLTRMIEILEIRTEEEARAGMQPMVIFLGDYVDRGPDSAGVIELLLQDRLPGVERRFLRGNHEQSMMDYLRDPLANRAWMLQGGAETLRSYGVQPPSPVGAKDEDWTEAAAALNEKLPATHRAFLEGLERYIALGDFAFVHAGVDFDVPLDRQLDRDLYWARERFLASKRAYSHCIVHGHTPSEEPYIDERRVGIDTGAYASGVLTAARFSRDIVTFIRATERH